MASRAAAASSVARPGAAAAVEEEDVDVDTLVDQAPGSYGHPAYAAAAPAPPAEAPPPKTARSRPTNNQLLYKAYFRWSHYQFKLQPGLVLPEETEACASVTSAFLQVLNTLFFVETRRIENPRNILQLLSMNTRRTKVVELSSGTHRVPDELKRHSLSDGGTGSYSTNLDRNRYGNDDQYLSTVIRYDLEFLDLCPCMVDVEIIDAKNGQGSILVSADPEMCNCGSAGAGGMGAALAPAGHTIIGRHMQQTSPLALGAGRGAGTPALPAAARSAQRAASGGGGEAPGPGAAPAAHPAASKNSGSELFDALLIAATVNDDAGGATSKQAASAAAAAPPPGIPRARSRLWHTGASGEGDSLQNAVEAFKAGETDEIASGQPSWEGGRASPAPLPAPGARPRRIPRRSSLSNMAGLSSAAADDGIASLPPVAPLSAGRTPGLPAGPAPGLPTRGEESAENGPRQGAEPAGGDAEGAAGGVAHASSVASLTAAKETAEREAAAGKTAAQAQGGSAATPPLDGPPAPTSQAAGEAVDGPQLQSPANGPVSGAPADKRKPCAAAAGEPPSKRAAVAAAQPEAVSLSAG